MALGILDFGYKAQSIPCFLLSLANRFPCAVYSRVVNPWRAVVLASVVGLGCRGDGQGMVGEPWGGTAYVQMDVFMGSSWCGLKEGTYDNLILKSTKLSYVIGCTWEWEVWL